MRCLYGMVWLDLGGSWCLEGGEIVGDVSFEVLPYLLWLSMMMFLKSAHSGAWALRSKNRSLP